MLRVAPWMGTLDIVVHDNKVTKNFGVNQFQSKRYPTRTLPTPQGIRSSGPPCLPHPAAIINGCAMTRTRWRRGRRQRGEQDQRHLTKTPEIGVQCSAKALMPKSLKAHESKYPAWTGRGYQNHGDLAMRSPVDQQADVNEEAER